MPSPVLPSLSEWESFYVITGSGAAALTGLMFVVVALTAETRAATGSEAVNAFATPTVVHFCAVLLVAAILTMPGHAIASLSLCLGACGVAGLVYVGVVVGRVRQQTEYAAVREDWAWHVVLPVVAYVSLMGAAVALWRRPGPALRVVGATALLLLYIGIHNAWDAATWIAQRRTEEV